MPLLKSWINVSFGDLRDIHKTWWLQFNNRKALSGVKLHMPEHTWWSITTRQSWHQCDAKFCTYALKVEMEVEKAPTCWIIDWISWTSWASCYININTRTSNNYPRSDNHVHMRTTQRSKWTPSTFKLEPSAPFINWPLAVQSITVEKCHLIAERCAP